MKNEDLKRANEIISEIKELNNHITELKGDRENLYEGDTARIRVENNYENDAKALKSAFLPMAIPEFMELYISKCEKKIKQLEKEFEKL